ncbi:helix-turn-helix transcriptional regulator [Bifidobacterium simiarum]|uniref:Transcriptional regulator n=1 Tax=Bifidobacterium simiarum TaxID=2045441 RepID=A0A2M9HD42_9BIFI|nr:helix-turn-helix transcriptional regulator [Bifidobacterium simiarum]MBT1166247.1 helix-turn-helix transcriptional regulator [Bifidobacterium simiarum]PJM74735.1 transcriptional regulator [Bifidobacterium simiarum]
MSLRELRLKRGLTQQQLADKSGSSRGNIANYENGIIDVSNMTLGTALKICDALRVSNPRKLLDDVKPSKEKDTE